MSDNEHGLDDLNSVDGLNSINREDGALDALDIIIGDVARGMTAAAPGDDLARRVSVRIADAETARAQRAWFRPWVLAPAAAACLLVLAVLVARETRKSELLPPAPTVASVTPPAVVTPERPEGPATKPLEPAVASRRTAVEQVTRRIRAAVLPAALPEDVAVTPLALAPIEGIDRLDVQPLARSERIDINPIAINRIEIAAMP